MSPTEDAKSGAGACGGGGKKRAPLAARGSPMKHIERGSHADGEPSLNRPQDNSRSHKGEKKSLYRKCRWSGPVSRGKGSIPRD